MQKHCGGYRIAPVDGDALPALLAFLVSPLDANERQNRAAPILESLRLGRLDFSGSHAAWLGDAMVGGLFVQRQGRDTVIVMPPLATEPHIVVMLAQSFHEFCEAEQILTAIMVSDDVDDTETPRLMRFTVLSPLVSLVCGEEMFPTATPQLAATLRPVVSKDATPQEELAALRSVIEIVERTYEASLDFPDLLGTCGARAIVDGYRLAEVHDLRFWYAIHRHDTAGRAANEPCGVLLLNDHARESGIEIVYVGLEKESRGHGLGRGLVAWTQWLARQAGRRWVFVSVDAANAPAVNIYSRAGFHEYQRKLISTVVRHSRTFQNYSIQDSQSTELREQDSNL